MSEAVKYLIGALGSLLALYIYSRSRTVDEAKQAAQTAANAKTLDEHDEDINDLKHAAAQQEVVNRYVERELQMMRERFHDIANKMQHAALRPRKTRGDGGE